MQIADLFNTTSHDVKLLGISTGRGLVDVVAEDEIDWSAVVRVEVRSIRGMFWNTEVVFLNGTSALLSSDISFSVAESGAQELAADYAVPIEFTRSAGRERIVRNRPRRDDMEGVAA